MTLTLSSNFASLSCQNPTIHWLQVGQKVVCQIDSIYNVWMRAQNSTSSLPNLQLQRAGCSRWEWKAAMSCVISKSMNLYSWSRESPDVGKNFFPWTFWPRRNSRTYKPNFKLAVKLQQRFGKVGSWNKQKRTAWSLGITYIISSELPVFLVKQTVVRHINESHVQPSQYHRGTECSHMEHILGELSVQKPQLQSYCRM